MSRSAHPIWTVLGGITGLLALALALFVGFVGDPRDWWAQKTRSDDATRTVQTFLAEMQRAGYRHSDAAREERVDHALRLTEFRQDDPAFALWRIGPDPYVWTHLGVRATDVTRNKATVTAANLNRWMLRRAKSGCWTLHGDFKLAWRTGAWQITSLPAFSRRCSGAELRETWGPDASTTRGVIYWEGRFQRIDPLTPSSHGRIRNDGTPRAWVAARAVDPERRRRGQTVLPQDGDTRTAWGVSAPEAPGDPADPSTASWGAISFPLPAKVHLLRLRFHNGVATAGAGEDGRIRTATVTAGGRQVELSLRDRIGSQQVDCDFGDADSVTIEVTGVWSPPGVPAPQAGAALSQVDFWGMPSGASVAPAPSGRYAYVVGPDPPGDRPEFLSCTDVPPVADAVPAAASTDPQG